MKIFLIPLFFLFLFNFVSASEYSDCSIYGTCVPKGTGSSNITNVFNSSITNNITNNITTTNNITNNISIENNITFSNLSGFNTSQFQADANGNLTLIESWLDTFVLTYNYITQAMANSLFNYTIEIDAVNSSLNFTNYSLTGYINSISATVNDSYLPYNNSISNVDLNNYNISNIQYITADSIKLSSPANLKPTCSSSYRGALWFNRNALGVADTLEVCTKNELDTYAWSMVSLI